MNAKETEKEMYKVFKEYREANKTLIDEWLEIIFLTPQWWIGLFLGVIPWFLWWKFHNKKFTGDLFRAGLFMSLICLILDCIGVQLGLWGYVYDVLPFIPGYIPWDLTLFPILTMFFIEIKPHIHPFSKSLIFSFFTSFIGEPIADYLIIYEPLNWAYYYSFPIYIILYLITDRIAKGKVFNPSL